MFVCGKCICYEALDTDFKACSPINVELSKQSMQNASLHLVPEKLLKNDTESCRAAPYFPIIELWLVRARSSIQQHVENLIIKSSQCHANAMWFILYRQFKCWGLLTQNKSSFVLSCLPWIYAPNMFSARFERVLLMFKQPHIIYTYCPSRYNMVFSYNKNNVFPKSV